MANWTIEKARQFEELQAQHKEWIGTVVPSIQDTLNTLTVSGATLTHEDIISFINNADAIIKLLTPYSRK